MRKKIFLVKSFLRFFLLYSFQRTAPVCQAERLILSKLNSTSIADVRPDLQWNFFHRCLLRKEVIQPHLPIRLPCYDFTPIIGSTLDGWLLAVTPPASGVSNSHSVTGGVYKARERIHRGMLTRDY